MRRSWIAFPTLALAGAAALSWGGAGAGMAGFDSLWSSWLGRSPGPSAPWHDEGSRTDALPHEAAVPPGPAPGAVTSAPEAGGQHPSVQALSRKLRQLQTTTEGRLILNPPQGDARELALRLRQDPAALDRVAGTARRLSRLMSECLLDHLCDQGPEDGYFDPDRTPGHHILNKSLQTLQAVADTEGDVPHGGHHSRQLPPPAALLRNLAISNPETQILSLELLAREPASDSLRQQLLSEAPLVRDEAKPIYFAVMQDLSRGSAQAHGQFVSTLYHSLRTDDPVTVTDTVDQLGKITLTRNEYQEAVHQLCRFRSTPPVWRQLDAGLVSYAETQGYSSAPDPDRVCG